MQFYTALQQAISLSVAKILSTNPALEALIGRKLTPADGQYMLAELEEDLKEDQHAEAN